MTMATWHDGMAMRCDAAKAVTDASRACNLLSHSPRRHTEEDKQAAAGRLDRAKARRGEIEAEFARLYPDSPI